MMENRRGSSNTYYFAAIVFLLSSITNFYKGNISSGIVFLALTAGYIVLILILRKHYDKHNGENK